MTEWLLKCEVCGTERRLSVGFNLAIFKGKIYLYCRRCKMNTEHKILGYIDEEGRLVAPEGLAGSDIID